MRAHLRTVIVVLLAVSLLAWFLRHADLHQVWREIQRGRLDLLMLAVAATAVTYVLRAVRWQYLLRPLGRPPFRVVLATTIIGFAATSLLPARAGEVVRPYLLARKAGFSATAAFATIIVERLLDLLTVIVLFGSYLVVFDPGMATLNPAVFRALQVGGLWASIGGLAGLGVMMVLAGHPERLGAWPAPRPASYNCSSKDSPWFVSPSAWQWRAACHCRCGCRLHVAFGP